MSQLLDLIDAYRDAHGQPSDASIARAIGLSPQAISSWRKRGLKAVPSHAALREFARLAHLDYESVVLRAAMVDAGWLDADAEAEVRANVERRKARKSSPEAGGEKGSRTGTD